MHVKILFSTSVVWKYLQTYDKKKVVLQSSRTLRNRLKQPLISYTKKLKKPRCGKPASFRQKFLSPSCIKKYSSLDTTWYSCLQKAQFGESHVRKKIGLRISHGELTKIKLVSSQPNQPYEKISKRGGDMEGDEQKESTSGGCGGFRA